jgi:hypothetical protein
MVFEKTENEVTDLTDQYYIGVKLVKAYLTS